MQTHMDFKQKLETALRPLVRQLRSQLRALKTLDVLNRYQLRIDLVQADKSKVPDGFIFKWRYLWAQLLSEPQRDVGALSDVGVARLDALIEQVFEMYEMGALYERGRVERSEEEFLTRLGLALRVREPEVLAFPEQIRDWSMARLQPFDDRYFLPCFGVHFEEIVQWITRLIRTSEAKLNASVNDLGPIAKELESIRVRLAEGELDDKGARNEAARLGIEKRLSTNAYDADNVHVFSRDELQSGIFGRAAATLVRLFSIVPGEVGVGCVFPHDVNPLEHKMFVALPADRFYFLDRLTPTKLSRRRSKVRYWLIIGCGVVT